MQLFFHLMFYVLHLMLYKYCYFQKIIIRYFSLSALFYLASKIKKEKALKFKHCHKITLSIPKNKNSLLLTPKIWSIHAFLISMEVIFVTLSQNYFEYSKEQKQSFVNPCNLKYTRFSYFHGSNIRETNVWWILGILSKLCWFINL